MKTIVCLRSLPGAGKSSLAKIIAENKNAIICEADDYFMVNGEYKFDATKLGFAHAQCQNKVIESIKNGVDLIIVSSTSSTEKEVNVYKNLAEQHNYRFTSVIVENRHGNKSVHNVPESVVENMKNRFSIKL